MAKAIDHVKTCLADFRRRNGREPSTVEDYRAIGASAKRREVFAQAAAELAPDFKEEEIAVPTYFGVQEMEA